MCTWEGLKAIALESGTGGESMRAGGSLCDRKLVINNRGHGIGEKNFELCAPYLACGDQPAAIGAVVQALEAGQRFVTLRGATGTGKTFVMANVITAMQVCSCVCFCAARTRE